MAKGSVTAKRKPKSEEATKKPASSKKSDKKKDNTVNQLQQQVGNRAVQRLLSHKGLHPSMTGVKPQPEAEKKEPGKKPKKDLVEAGTVKVEKPRVDYYNVNGSNLAQVKQQIKRDGKWYEHEYRYAVKSENGVITRVDVIVQITVHLPKWTGPGWDQASRSDKLAWLDMLSYETPPNERYEELTRMPAGWIGVNWDEAPDALRSEWNGRLQKRQQQEHAYLDAVMRRVFILQQRMLGQPEKQTKPIFTQFQKDLKIEVDAYNRQLKFGQPQKLSIGTGVMLK